MRLILASLALTISCAIATPLLDYPPQSEDYPMENWPAAPSPMLRRELLAEYLASLDNPASQPQEAMPAMEGREKRLWGRNRWYGNKYRDNKSYGFWITALNKAGNWKRGKRAAQSLETQNA